MQAIDRLIIPLDVPTVIDAERMVDQLGDAVSFYKIGYHLAFAGGLGFVAELLSGGKQVFLDMKLHDIESVVAKGVENIARLGVQMTTVHAYPKEMREAVRAAEGSQLCLLGVSILTSMDDADLSQAGYAHSAHEMVMKRAAQASDSGMGGVVSSAQEASAVRSIIKSDMAIVTPGIRPAGSELGDQKRVMTPGDAIRSGATHLVVGRPVTGAEDPKAAAQAIIQEISEAEKNSD